MHIPQCFLVHSFCFFISFYRVSLCFRGNGGLVSFSFSFCGLAVSSPTRSVLASIFEFSLRERRRGALELVSAFWCLLGACALGKLPLHTHIMTALPAAIEGRGDEGATLARPSFVFTYGPFFWGRNSAHHGLNFYPRLWGGFSRGQTIGQGNFMDYGTVLTRTSARKSWVLAFWGKLVKHARQ